MSDTIGGHDLRIRFKQSASWHGTGTNRAAHVVRNCPLPLYSPEPGEEDVAIFLGLDPNGVALEVMAVELDDALVVVHAMKLRPKYRDAFRRVMGTPKR